jgi:hypothetical protein
LTFLENTAPAKPRPDQSPASDMSGRLIWEYLSLVWTYNTERRQQTDPAAEPHWDFWECMYVWRPGAEKAEVYDTREPDAEGRKPKVPDVVNGLGAEGWEMVGFESDRSRVQRSTTHGLQGWNWPPVGDPVRRRYFFKRPVAQG